MIVICIKEGHDITIGKRYNAEYVDHHLKLNPGRFLCGEKELMELMNDDGRICYYHSDKFKLLEDIREEKLKLLDI